MGSSGRHRARGPFPHALGMSLLLVMLMACGGGGSSPSGPTPSTISSVSPACTPSTIAVDATSQCNATVKGTGNYSSAVTWSTSSGTVNASGVFTAPASAGAVTVTATSMQDPTKSGTASVTVQSSPPASSTITSVQVVCTPSSVSTNATSQCSATVKGTGNYSSAVTWSASATGRAGNQRSARGIATQAANDAFCGGTVGLPRLTIAGRVAFPGNHAHRSVTAVS